MDYWKNKETILNFSQGNAKVLWGFYFNVILIYNDSI